MTYRDRPIRCPRCRVDIERPVFLGGVDVDRCFHDQLLWFDLGEHQRTLDRAHAQHAARNRSWLARWLDDR